MQHTVPANGEGAQMLSSLTTVPRSRAQTVMVICGAGRRGVLSLPSCVREATDRCTDRCTTDRCTTDRCTTAKTNVGRIAADTMRMAQRAEGALQRTLARREERAQRSGVVQPAGSQEYKHQKNSDLRSYACVFFATPDATHLK